jgi:hypothetical protein
MCNTEEKGESWENLPAGRQGGRKPKKLFVFPSFLFSIFPLLHKGLNLRK